MNEDTYRAAVQTARELLEPVMDRFSPDGSDRYVSEWLAMSARFYFDLANVDGLIDTAVPDFAKVVAASETVKVSDYYSHLLLCYIAARWLEYGNPLYPAAARYEIGEYSDGDRQGLPDVLAKYVAATLRGQLTARRKPGRVRFWGRDLTITQVVEEVSQRHGLARIYRGVTSAPHAVADALRELRGPHIGADQISKIYQLNKRHLMPRKI